MVSCYIYVECIKARAVVAGKPVRVLLSAVTKLVTQLVPAFAPLGSAARHAAHIAVSLALSPPSWR